jgi:signal transduction histidine kinase
LSVGTGATFVYIPAYTFGEYHRHPAVTYRPVMTVPATSRRDRVVDLLLFLLAVCFTVLALFDDLEQHLSPTLLTMDVVMGGVGCLGVWLRRRRPVAFAVVMGLFSIFSLAAAGVALIALFAVAVHRRFAVVAPIVVGYAVAASLANLVRPDMTVTHWSQAVLGIVFVTAMLAWGMYVRARRLAVQERARRAEAERELLVATARQLERNRIAREMHDVLAHSISLVSLHAGALELRLTDEDAKVAGVIRECAHRALEDLRDVIGMLRTEPSAVDDTPERPQPTLADLPELVEASRRAGTAVELSQEPVPGAVPAMIGRSAYRIVQEGLTNARKHAPGSKVSVTVRAAAGEGVTVEIRNPCPAGAAGIPGTGTGIIGLAERAALAGGRLEHGRTESGDFRLWAWLPWPT